MRDIKAITASAGLACLPCHLLHPQSASKQLLICILASRYLNTKYNNEEPQLLNTSTPVSKKLIIHCFIATEVQLYRFQNIGKGIIKKNGYQHRSEDLERCQNCGTIFPPLLQEINWFLIVFYWHPDLLLTTEKHLANIKPKEKQRKEKVQQQFGTNKQWLT